MLYWQALSYQSTKKKKAIQPNVEVDNDESEVASTVASSVACHEDVDEDNVSNKYFALFYFVSNLSLRMIDL